MSLLKKIFIAGIFVGGLLLLTVWWCNFKIESATENYTTSNISKLPSQKVGLLLGTSKLLKSGKPNAYFFNRIDAAVKLFKSGKIENIIVSGDNSVAHYNEPEDMKNALVDAGVPEEKIYEDFAGFRTLDSVIRAKEVFGQQSFIIISQRLHNERAIYLAQENNLQTYGYNAKDVKNYAGFKTQIREKLARTKVFWDKLFNVEPKFGGQKIIIK